jgi:hypothetical protein
VPLRSPDELLSPNTTALVSVSSCPSEEGTRAASGLDSAKTMNVLAGRPVQLIAMLEPVVIAREEPGPSFGGADPLNVHDAPFIDPA